MSSTDRDRLRLQQLLAHKGYARPFVGPVPRVRLGEPQRYIINLAVEGREVRLGGDQGGTYEELLAEIVRLPRVTTGP